MSFQGETVVLGSYPSLETLLGTTDSSSHLTSPALSSKRKDSLVSYPSLLADKPHSPLYPDLPKFKHIPSITMYVGSTTPSEAPKRREDVGAKIARGTFLHRFTAVDLIPKMMLDNLCLQTGNLENFEPWHPEKEHRISNEVRAIAGYIFDQNKAKPLTEQIKNMNQAIGEVFATSLP